MEEGLVIRGIEQGRRFPRRRGAATSRCRNEVFKKFSTRSMRPVVNFETCIKCTLCWLQCPDTCFRRDARRPVRRQHGSLLRLRRLRSRLPGARLRHHGQRGRVQRQRQPVAVVAEGQRRLQQVDDLRWWTRQRPKPAPTASTTLAATPKRFKLRRHD